MGNPTTEQKIVKAAKKIFTQKGYTATRTRDIADEAQVNLALLNYYFKSKQNLFRIVLVEKFEKLFSVLSPILSDEEVRLEKKIEIVIDNYMQLLSKEEDLPLFILNELKVNADMFGDTLKKVKRTSYPVIEKQLREYGSTVSPIDFIINIVSLALFPYIAKALFISGGLFDTEEFTQIMNRRKEAIPEWIMKTMI